MADIITFPEIPDTYNSVINRNGKHHKTSCNWYNWRSKTNHIPRVKSRPSPSDTFEYRNNRLVNTKSLQYQGVKDSCNANWEGDILSKRTAVPGGEARDYNIYTFSQHDNRHKIELPAKKTELSRNVLNQSSSANVTETLNWSHHNQPSNQKERYQRRENLPSYYTQVDDFRNQAMTTSGPRSVSAARYRRFPKTHDDGLDKFSKFTAENEKNCILNHDVSFNKKGGNKLLDKKELMRLQSLCQPQYYTGSKNVHARGEPQRSAPVKDKNQEWNYSFHTHTHSSKVGDNTKYACYRF